jgi:hypothetical protein
MMREQTQQFDNFTTVAESLTHATGAPFPEAVQAVRWVQAYVKRCVEAGLENDLLIAMERSGLGHVTEMLIAAVRR